MNKSDLTASIALCTYNGEKYLQEQLDSLAKQTRLPDELVVCDDGSTDDTIEILQAFAKTSPFPVRIERNETNLGFVHNFEKCSHLCSGNIIFYCDQDDIWLQDKVEKFLSCFNNNPKVGIVLCDAQMIDSNRKTLKSRTSHALGNIQKLASLAQKDSALFTCKISPSSWAGMSMAFRNNFKDLLYPFPEVIGHDAWTLQALGAISDIYLIPQPLVLYRIHGNNQLGDEVDTLLKQKRIAQNNKTIQMYRLNSNSLSCVLERLDSMPKYVISNQTRTLYKEKARHSLIRYEIYTHKVNKWLYILRETINGNYFRFGRGILSIGMDILS